jgi:hypothetical protein
MGQPVVVALRVIFAVLALLLFAFAGLGMNEPPKFRFLGWGLFFLTLAFFVAVRP